MVKNLYVNTRFFKCVGIILILFIVGFSFNVLFVVGKILVYILGAIFLIDLLVLFISKNPVFGIRFVSERLSNGDQNEIRVHLENKYGE